MIQAQILICDLHEGYLGSLDNGLALKGQANVSPQLTFTDLRWPKPQVGDPRQRTRSAGSDAEDAAQPLLPDLADDGVQGGAEDRHQLRYAVLVDVDAVVEQRVCKRWGSS